MSDANGRIWALIGVLATVLCLGYFYALDRVMFSSAGFSSNFDLLLSVYDARAAWLSCLICILALLWTDVAPIATLTDFIGRRILVLLPGLIAILAIASVVVYHAYPLAMDEYAPVFQAKIFAMGQIEAHFPPYLVNWLVVPGFNGMFLFGSPLTGRVVEAYWPGFALLLAPFEWLGVPWLCNPLLAGVGLYFIHRITLEITGDRRAAGFAVLFSIASGAYVANAISFYSMQAHLTANLAFAWLLMSGSRRRAFAAGLVGSLALILHNPVPHMLFALPWLLFVVVERERRRQIWPLMLGYLPVSIIGGIGWFVLRNKIGADLHHAASAAGGIASAFRWPDAVMLNARVAGLVKMWVWAVPCLLLFALIGALRLRHNPYIRLLTLSAVVTFAGYMIVIFDQGYGWGYRYFHSAWGAIPILAGCAMSGERESNAGLTAFAGATALLSLFFLVPFQLSQIDGYISRHLAQVPKPARPGNDVFFVNPQGGYYIADMVQNDPGLRSKDLMMISHGSRRNEVLVRRYWPAATKVNWGPFGEEWNLGPVDQRRRTRDDPHLHFVFPATAVTRSR